MEVFHTNISKQAHVWLPEDCTARVSDRQAAADKPAFSMWADPKSFSRSGQNTPRRTKIVSSSTWSAAGVTRWPRTDPILNISVFHQGKVETEITYS